MIKGMVKDFFFYYGGGEKNPTINNRCSFKVKQNNWNLKATFVSHSGGRRFSVALRAAVTHNTSRKKQNSHNIHKLKAILVWKKMYSAGLQLTVRIKRFLNQKEIKSK